MNLDSEEFWSVARLGHLLFEQEEYEDARQVFEGLTAVRPQLAYPWEALGWIASAMGEEQRAIEFLKHAVKLGAGPETAVRLAEELMRTGQNSEAINVLQGVGNAVGSIGQRARALLKRCRRLPRSARGEA